MNKSYLHRVTLPTLGSVKINFFGVAADVIQLYNKTNEFDRQKNMKHLGLIAEVFEGVSHTRYEYVMFQCALVDLIDNLHKGSPSLSVGELKVNGSSISGNGLLKAWFLLSNFGHAKNIIGDEKALLLYALKRKKFKSVLLNPIIDKQLRNYCEEIINNFDYLNFHYVLSIRRVYKTFRATVPIREELIKYLKLLLLKTNKDYRLNEEKLEQLKQLFHTIRAISIIQLDGHYSHIPMNIDLIASIISLDSIENIYLNKHFSYSLSPIMSHLNEELYLNKQVLGVHREYEHLALEILDNNKHRYNELLETAIYDGIVHLNQLNKQLIHFTRIKINDSIKKNKHIYDDIVDLQKIRSGCRSIQYTVTENKYSNTRCIDFFFHKQEFGPDQFIAFVYNICEYVRELVFVLSDNNNVHLKKVLDKILGFIKEYNVPNETIQKIMDSTSEITVPLLLDSFNKEIVPIFREIFWSILNYFISDNYYIDIDINTKEYSEFALKFPSGEINTLRRNFALAKQQESTDIDRVHEIEQLEKSACRKFNGYVLACLSRITVYDLSKPPSKRKVTDIDSVVIKSNANNFIIEFHESKNIKKNREKVAAKELRQKFVRVLNHNAKGYRIKHVKNMGAKLVIMFKKR